MPDDGVLVELDSRGRVATSDHQRYLAHEGLNGTVVLTPAVVIPELEPRFLANPELVEPIHANRANHNAWSYAAAPESKPHHQNPLVALTAHLQIDSLPEDAHNELRRRARLAAATIRTRPLQKTRAPRISAHPRPGRAPSGRRPLITH